MSVPDVVGPANEGLAAVFGRRFPYYPPNGVAHNFVELYGGDIVPMQHYEPDAVTFHSDHYYNTSTNGLYRRIVTRNEPMIGRTRAYWKLISQ